MALRMVDDVLAPKGAIVYEYYGRNPFSVYSGLGRKLQEIFHVRGKDVFEDDFRWDLTADPRPFFFIIRVEKGMDSFTEGVVGIKFFGAQPTDPTKNGKLLIEIFGTLETNFFGKNTPLTALQKIILEPFVWIYHHVYYYKIRRQYIRFFQEGIELLEAFFRERLGTEMRERLTPYVAEEI